ncbi:hypothetical protein F5141DRAFT_1216422 [Pisolithus sp. B1]|nr:hypothetical protein F5141DRAFT_1216422 [Pisolithus sp. B1]
MPQTPNDERDRLLRLLEAHGQEFMSSFELPPPLKKRKKNSNLRRTTNPTVHLEERDTSGAPEGCGGFSHIDRKQGSQTTRVHTSEHDRERAASSSRAPDVTVFSDSAIKHVKSNDTSKGSRKSFMSSKVVDIKRDILPPEGVPREHSEDEWTNAQNDALLYRLLHTKLLSGSLNEELGLSHAQKEKALSGKSFGAFRPM